MENKGIYMTITDLDNPASGVAKKIKMQCDAFEDNGFAMCEIFYSDSSLIEKLTSRLPLYYRKNCKGIIRKLKLINLKEYSFVYFRYPSSSRGFIDILKYIKQNGNGLKIIIEIATYPYEQEYKRIIDLPVLLIDKIYRKKLKEYVDLIVECGSIEREIWGIPAVEITNGINVKKYKPKVYTECKSEFHILGVAALADYHGYDRIIKGMKLYYSNNTDYKVIFHIVGDGEEKDNLIRMVKQMNLQEYVIFHGYQSGNELQAIYNQCDIAIGAIATHRAFDFERISPLKTREYCSIGIPFLTLEKDFIFNTKAFPYSISCEDCETPIDISALILFVNELRNKYTIQEIITNMRKFAEENLSWTSVLKPVCEYINK